MKRILVFFLALFSSLSGVVKAADSGTASLEIVCSGLKDGDRALYDVYGPDGNKIYSVALQGFDAGKSVSRRIKGLKPGLYRVEATGWNWSYDESPSSLELTVGSGETAVFSFTSAKRRGLSTHYEDGRLNSFKHL